MLLNLNMEKYKKIKSKEKNIKKHVSEISSRKDKNEFIILNEKEAKGYCVNKFDNGDVYLGYSINNSRNRHGFYSYFKNSQTNESRYYLGQWKSNLRHGLGIYLWSQQFDNFENSNFKAFAGKFLEDNFEKGTYLSKKGNNYFIYHGTFEGMNIKNGNNSFYYSANLEKLMYGQFEKNKFIKGYVALFNDEGIIKEIHKYNMDMDDNYTNVKKLMSDFRNIIMSKDYFGIIFNVFINAIEFKDNNLNDINAINTYKYEEFLEICKSHKKVTIFNDIENIY